MTAIMDLSFPGQWTATATSCIPHDSVYMPGPRAGKSENGFFRCDTWLQIFQNDSKICEAEVTLTPRSNKICKPWYKNLLSLKFETGSYFLKPMKNSVHLDKWDKSTFKNPLNLCLQFM